MGFSRRSARDALSALLIAGTLIGCGAEAEAQPQVRRGAPLEGDVTAALDPRTDRLADAIAEESGPEGSIEGEAPVLDENGEIVLGVQTPLFDPSGTSMRTFHAALRRAAMGEGQARVVVYGASHVAGDFATGTLRRMLQQEFGDAGHGFVMPAHPWPHYRHLDITVESNHRLWEAARVRVGETVAGLYGLAGVALTSSSARAFGRVVTGERHASRFELFYLRQPEGGTVEVRIDDRVVGRVRTRGADTGGDYALFTVPDGPHSFEIRPRGDGPVTVYGVAVEREVPGVVIDTLGINGARAAAQLLWDETLWAEHVRRRNPDLVVLAYGTNESGDDDQPIEIYERDLRRVVARARATVPNASCLLIGPSDRPIANRDGTFSERPRTAMVVDTQRRVAAEMGCGFFDLVGFGGGPMHMVQWAAQDPAWAQRDHVHYTLRGYQRLGEVLHGALLDGYDGPTAMIAATERPSTTATP
ncbi:GDSL-type esterase/lipase family protein [Sandaracinus amylolyticus]|uniref:GDSL-type esterase/lipase family protein n=1 Tax=Sandaracinus amylolyticus TaxID=927083 RepID=UPI001F1EBCFD|nr:GDSL-type esterase/lipase family protein [Sandaracinus amylolyticus]UJR79372.1 GDSL-like Lipase/Acylhydrolase [Sandaracinus amylolyticus]